MLRLAAIRVRNYDAIYTFSSAGGPHASTPALRLIERNRAEEACRRMPRAHVCACCVWSRGAGWDVDDEWWSCRDDAGGGYPAFVRGVAVERRASGRGGEVCVEVRPMAVGGRAPFHGGQWRSYLPDQLSLSEDAGRAYAVGGIATAELGLHGGGVEGSREAGFVLRGCDQMSLVGRSLQHRSGRLHFANRLPSRTVDAGHASARG